MISIFTLLLINYVDLLDAPSSVSATFIDNGIAIQWTRPYALSGIDVTGYLINVSVVGGKASVPNVTYVSAYVSNNDCYNYLVCVQAVTAAGFGGAACVNKSREGRKIKRSALFP